MELEKVKAITKSSGSRKDKKTNREQDKRWSIQFLELLVREFEEEKRLEKKRRVSEEKGKQKETMKQADMSEDYDCRMVEKGKEEVPSDWDSFEVTRDFTEPVLESELYVDLIEPVKSVGNWQADILYKIANIIMQDYYTNKLGLRAVGELFYGCFQKCIEKNRQIENSKEKKQEILNTLYEYFSRVNARKSVAFNEREGRRLVEECGISWAGTTYYNSHYYYTWDKMQRLFRKVYREIAREQEIKGVSISKIESQTQFLHVGGLTFHSVFVWIQQKDNHPAKQYGMRDLTRIPPKHFVYLYRNHYAKSEKTSLILLEKRMKKCCIEKEKYLWRSFRIEDGRDYHNGMSYLLEGTILDEADEENYGAVMGFLQNFILYRVSGCVEFLCCWRRE